LIEELQNYSWPGNVRELKNTIERVVIMHPSVKVSRERPARARQGRAASSVLQISILQGSDDAYHREFIQSKLAELRVTCREPQS